MGHHQKQEKEIVMTQRVSDEVLGCFARRQADWFERVRKGSLDPDEVAHEVQRLIDRGAEFQYTLSEPYRVVVPHGTDSIKKLLRAGEYDFVNPYVTDQNFPNVRTADDEFDIWLAHFDSEIELEKIVRTLRAGGYEPITMADLLAFGAKFPRVQLQFPIVELSPAWQGNDHRQRYGFLFRSPLNQKKRRLSLEVEEVGAAWMSHCRFAVRLARSAQQAGE